MAREQVDRQEGIHMDPSLPLGQDLPIQEGNTNGKAPENGSSVALPLSSAPFSGGIEAAASLHSGPALTEAKGQAYRDKVPPGISRKPVDLPAWERVKLARHADRPHTLDYIQRLCTDFVELHGDRLFGDDAAIVGGLALFDGQAVMIMGHQKGSTTKENIARNFAQAHPEGFRKAQRLMEHAARFGFPILTFIDTPGANPGMQAEERGIGQAIAANLKTMLTIGVPIIATVIGEGGSGGALAIGVGDRVLMLENSIYSVASPEASAAILWRDAGQAAAAAAAMRITAQDLLGFGIIDEVIPEPAGGAHTDKDVAMEAVQEAIARHLATLKKKTPKELLKSRHLKYESIGTFSG